MKCFSIFLLVFSSLSSQDFITFDDLDSDYQHLVDKAEEGMQKAYNPYSHFSVGCAALGIMDGKESIVFGANCENASYGLSICAERTVLCQANNLGLETIHAMAIIADNSTPTAPCGACRQFIKEFADRYDTNIVLILSSTDKQKILVTTIEDLLPFSFGPKDLCHPGH